MTLARILVVEDEPLTALEEQAILERMDCEVVAIAPSGEKAVADAEEFQPDLVLMDIKLAGEMDGREAARLILQRRDILVIFVSAFVDQTILDEGHLCVNKPFTPAELSKAVENALAR